MQNESICKPTEEKKAQPWWERTHAHSDVCNCHEPSAIHGDSHLGESLMRCGCAHCCATLG